MNKKAYEFSFAWLFAILVGAVIIFLAIYITTQIVDVERTRIDTVRAKEIGVLLTPVETNLEQSKLATISVPQEIRLFNNCTTNSNFGEQKLSALTKSGIGKNWQPEPGVTSTFYNKYIFSQAELHSDNELYIFTKPFKFPYKIADLTIIWPDKTSYCFVFDSDAGKRGIIKTELENLKPKHVIRVSAKTDCQENAKTICFDDSSCNINININQEKVTLENGETVSYIESQDSSDRFALLFAAVFSDSELYKCQVERLTMKAANLADLYRLKSNYLTTKGCRSAPLLPTLLQNYKSSLSSTKSFTNSKSEADNLRIANGNLGCGLF